MGSPGRCAFGVIEIRIKQAHEQFTTNGKFFQPSARHSGLGQVLSAGCRGKGRLGEDVWGSESPANR